MNKLSCQLLLVQTLVVAQCEIFIIEGEVMKYCGLPLYRHENCNQMTQLSRIQNIILLVPSTLMRSEQMNMTPLGLYSLRECAKLDSLFHRELQNGKCVENNTSEELPRLESLFILFLFWSPFLKCIVPGRVLPYGNCKIASLPLKHLKISKRYAMQSGL